MDHEFSTSALGSGQVGWDWFALQLDDGSDLMIFQIRQADGQVDPFSSGTLIAPDGSARHLTNEEFTLAVGATWRSAAPAPERPTRRAGSSQRPQSTCAWRSNPTWPIRN